MSVGWGFGEVACGFGEVVCAIVSVGWAFGDLMRACLFIVISTPRTGK